MDAHNQLREIQSMLYRMRETITTAVRNPHDQAARREVILLEDQIKECIARLLRRAGYDTNLPQNPQPPLGDARGQPQQVPKVERQQSDLAA